MAISALESIMTLLKNTVLCLSPGRAEYNRLNFKFSLRRNNTKSEEIGETNSQIREKVFKGFRSVEVAAIMTKYHFKTILHRLFDAFYN